jgi:hypothetical protein
MNYPFWYKELRGRPQLAISSMKPTEMVQDPIVSEDTLWQEECDMDDSYNDVDHLDTVDEY